MRLELRVITVDDEVGIIPIIHIIIIECLRIRILSFINRVNMKMAAININDDCCCAKIDLGTCFATDGSINSAVICTEFFYNGTTAICHDIADAAQRVHCHYSPEDLCKRVPAKEAIIGFLPILITGLILVLPSKPNGFINFTKFLRGQLLDLETHEDVGPTDRSQLVKEILGLLDSLGQSLIILAFLFKGYTSTIWVIIALHAILLLVTSFRGPKARKTRKAKERKENKGKGKNIIEVTDVYSDLSGSSIVKVLLMFACQVILLTMWLMSLIKTGLPDFSKGITYLYYGFGTIVQCAFMSKSSKQGANNDVIKETRNEIRRWRKITRSLQKDQKIRFREKKEADNGDNIKSAHLFEIQIRIITSLFVNRMGKSLLEFFVPVHLAHSQNELEFIYNAVKVYFIIALDDLKNSDLILLDSHGKDDNVAMEQEEGRVARSIENSSHNKRTHQDDSNIVYEQVRSGENEQVTSGAIEFFDCIPGTFVDSESNASS